MTACETSAVAGLADTAAVNAGGCWTVMGDDTLALAVSGAPLFRSDPVKVAPSVSEPALEGVQVQVSVEFTPGFTTCGRAGVAAVQIPEGDAVKVATVAEAPPGSVTVSWTVRTSPTLAVVGFPTTAMEAVSAAGASTVTDAETGGVAVTGSPEFASVPAAVPLSASVPALVGVQVKLKICEPFAAMLVAPGVTAPQVAAAVPETAGVTATPFACAPPPFTTVKVTVTTCETSTVPGVADTVAASAGGSWTAMGDERLALAVSTAPVLASEPVKDAPRVREPALEGVQVQVKVELTPGVTPCGGTGVAAVQIPEGVGVTAEMVADAPPVSLTLKVTLRTCPTLAAAGLPVTAMEAESAAGVSTVTEAETDGVAVTESPEFASVPDAVPLRLRVPALVGVQLRL